ncbi:MAG: Hsp70 family protein [Holosporaceae bacterium]|jgi:molecular chaperone HscA|nr:Hsp70 family protein [Holosporaceae bacterium]
MSTVGIDLGTTASVVAFVQHGVPRSIPTDVGKVTTPSVVTYENGETIVGREAIYRMNPARSIFSVKRFMGSNVKFFDKTPEEISAEILSYIKTSAELQLRNPIDSAVITVPAHFSDAQRTATKRAASIANIKVLRLINEPTAAAIAFGLDKKKEGIYAIYDLGGGTFDFSILRLMSGVFQVIATGGDNSLGGDDLDSSILEYNLKKLGLDVGELNDGEQMLGRLVAKSLKEKLGNHGEVRKNYIYHNKSYEFILSQKIMEDVAQVYLNRTLEIADRVFSDAAIDPREIDGIVAVGGMIKMPLVKTSVKNRYQVEILDDISADEAVALGAAIHADSLTSKSRSMLLLDVAPLTLGIETFGGNVDKIIHRNSAIPIAQRREYTTYQDKQIGIKFHIVQGERPLARDCRSLAKFELNGIPPMSAGMARVVVEFSVDVNGILSVKAHEKSTGISQTVLVEPSSGLSEDDMRAILESAAKNHNHDEIEAKNVRLRVESERIMRFLESILSEMSQLQKNAVLGEMQNLRQSIDSENYAEAVEYKNKLEAISGQFLDEIISRRLSREMIIAPLSAADTKSS